MNDLREFCDSAGLHAVFLAHRRVADEGRELRLVIGANGAVPRIFELTGMDGYLRCFADLEEALAQPRDASVPANGISGPLPGPTTP